MYIYIYLLICIYMYMYVYIGVWGVDPPKRDIFLPAGVFCECVRGQLGRETFGSLTLFGKLVSDRLSVPGSYRDRA